MGKYWSIVLKRVENIVGKRKKCWFQAFAPFSILFPEILSFRVVKSENHVQKTISLTDAIVGFFKLKAATSIVWPVIIQKTRGIIHFIDGSH